MRVCDLLAKLQTLDPETVVVLADQEDDTFRVSECLVRVALVSGSAFRDDSRRVWREAKPNARVDTVVSAVVLSPSLPFGLLSDEERALLARKAALLRDDEAARSRLV